MAPPACTREARKRHYYRSASAPERARNCTISIVNGFKMTTQSNFSSMFVYLLFCVVLLSSNAQSLTTRDNVDCTYANSTCSSCAGLCLDNEFYPLFPSRCHPSYMVSTGTAAMVLLLWYCSMAPRFECAHQQHLYSFSHNYLKHPTVSYLPITSVYLPSIETLVNTNRIIIALEQLKHTRDRWIKTYLLCTVAI